VSTLWRLMLLHALVLGTALTLLGYAAVGSVTARSMASVTHDLVEEVPEYASAAATRTANQSLYSFSRAYLQTHLLPEGHVLLIGLDGLPVLGSSGSRPVALAAAVDRLLRNPPTRTLITTVEATTGSYRVVASPVVDAGKHEGVLVSAASLDDVYAQRSRMLLVVLAEGTAVLYVALLSAYLILRRLLKSVSTLTVAAQEIADGDLSRRIDYDGPDDEVGELARTFDGMIARISSAFDSQRQLLADVSHQLRTPLTVVRGHLEVLGRTPCEDPSEVKAALDVALEELDYMASMVERLLLLGRSLEADFLETEPVDLRSFLVDLVESCQVIAERDFRLGEVPDLVVRVDAEKLRGALLNLVDNSVKATAPGDVISVSATYGESVPGSGAELVIALSDTGHGIAREAQGNVFERFRSYPMAHASSQPARAPFGEPASAPFGEPAEKGADPAVDPARSGNVDGALVARSQDYGSRTERNGSGGAPTDAMARRGSGLGLAIVKAVAEAHGGRAELESVPGEGCCVRIILPGTCTMDILLDASQAEGR